MKVLLERSCEPIPLITLYNPSFHIEIHYGSDALLICGSIIHLFLKLGKGKVQEESWEIGGANNKPVRLKQL